MTNTSLIFFPILTSLSVRCYTDRALATTPPYEHPSKGELVASAATGCPLHNNTHFVANHLLPVRMPFPSWDLAESRGGIKPVSSATKQSTGAAFLSSPSSPTITFPNYFFILPKIYFFIWIINFNSDTFVSSKTKKLLIAQLSRKNTKQSRTLTGCLNKQNNRRYPHKYRCFSTIPKATDLYPSMKMVVKKVLFSN